MINTIQFRKALLEVLLMVLIISCTGQKSNLFPRFGTETEPQKDIRTEQFVYSVRVLDSLESILMQTMQDDSLPDFMYDSCFSVHFKYNYHTFHPVFWDDCIIFEFVNKFDSSEVMKILNLYDTARLYKSCRTSRSYVCYKYTIRECLKIRLQIIEIENRISKNRASHIKQFRFSEEMRKFPDTSAYYIYSSKRKGVETHSYSEVFKFMPDGTVRKYNIFGSLNYEVLAKNEYIEYLYDYDSLRRSIVLKSEYLNMLYLKVSSSRMFVREINNGFEFYKPKIATQAEDTLNSYWMAKYRYKKHRIK